MRHVFIPLVLYSTHLFHEHPARSHTRAGSGLYEGMVLFDTESNRCPLLKTMGHPLHSVKSAVEEYDQSPSLNFCVIALHAVILHDDLVDEPAVVVSVGTTFDHR
jgi:hypothetical protein